MALDEQRKEKKAGGHMTPTPGHNVIIVLSYLCIEVYYMYVCMYVYIYIYIYIYTYI